MKKILSAILAMSLVLLLAACGSKGGEGTGNDGAKSVDLNQYYEDFMASLGADNTPAMMDVEAEALDSLYQGLSAYKTAQSVVKVAAINSVAFEFWWSWRTRATPRQWRTSSRPASTTR